jgi:D-lactate dehydrogenase (cytochrome)
MSEKAARYFTDLRYAVPDAINEIVKRSGFRKFSTDIAVPGDKLESMMAFYADTFRIERLNHVVFGHIGENHLHVNILPRSEGESKKAGELLLAFIRKGVRLGGTVSAEHGIGKLRREYLIEMYGRQGVDDMVRIKRAFDPNCILGLDNIFPREYLA